MFYLFGSRRHPGCLLVDQGRGRRGPAHGDRLAVRPVGPASSGTTRCSGVGRGQWQWVPGDGGRAGGQGARRRAAPPGYDTAVLTDLGTNDADQFGAAVTGRVGCGWIAEWLRAKEAGDAVALQRAGDALRGSHKWKALHQMDDEGGWAEAFWETADKVAAGNPPPAYLQTLGCE